jgi:hypothetical protein
MEMKKTFVKLGVLAVALALVFASCAQPTDEEGSSTGHDTILRLWIEDTATVAGTAPLLSDGNNIVITLASFTGDKWNHGTRASTLYDTVYKAVHDAAIEQGDTEPVAAAAATAAAETAVGDDVGVGLHALMRSGADGALFLLNNRSLTNEDTALNQQSPQTQGALEGRLYNQIGTGTVDNDGNIQAGQGYEITAPMLTRTKEGAYIDLFLYDTTAGRNQVWQKTGSYYVFLTKVASTGTGALPDGTYVYTKDATSRNQTEQENPLSGLNRDRRYNGNVKKVSFKNGVNELHLQNFSR